tara:strand:- start:668 stop:1063 length:396 start_codon:yes stop_codon:yes gene_type:complete
MLIYKMRRSNKRGNKRSNMRSNMRRNKRSRTRSKSRSQSRPSVNNSMSQCVQLFRKYRLTNQAKLVKWINNNHPDKVRSKQSSKLQDDYKFITGCFAQRKHILKQLKSKPKSKKKKSKSKVKKLKDNSFEW